MLPQTGTANHLRLADAVPRLVLSKAVKLKL